VPNAATIVIDGDNKPAKASFDETENLAKAFGSRITKTFAAIGAALAGAFAVRALVNFGRDAIAAAAESEQAEARLGAAITATGAAAGYKKEQLVKLSEELQNVTMFEAETTQGAMAIMSTFKNIRGDQFIHATKLAQDMATVLGGDLEGAAMQVSKALNDPVKGITALQRSGVSFTESQKEMIKTMAESGDIIGAQKMILAELNSEFGGAAEAMGKTFAGRAEIARNALGDIAEEIGFALMPSVEAMFPLLEELTAGLSGVAPILEVMVKTAVEGFKMMGGEMKGVFDFMIDSGIIAFTALQYLIENWDAYWESAYLNQKLNAEVSKNETVHFLTNTIPEALTWFADNWKEIFYDIGSYTATVVTNMGKNIKDLIVAIYEWMSGGEFNFEFTGLTEGFESTLKELPKFTERIPTELEREYQDKINDLNGNMLNFWEKRLKENRDKVAALFKKPDEAKEVVEPGSDLGDSTEDTKYEAIKGDDKKKKDKGSKASMEDLVALGNRIQSAAAGTPEEKLAEETKQLAKKVEKQKEVQEQANRATSDTNDLILKLNEHLAVLNTAIGGVGEGILKEAAENIGKVEENTRMIRTYASVIMGNTNTSNINEQEMIRGLRSAGALV
jgi:hypothetical protein